VGKRGEVVTLVSLAVRDGEQLLIEESPVRPTTAYSQFFLDQMPDCDGLDVLDFGCGSGVLACAAALGGARSVVACDIHPHGLAMTASNAKRNGLDHITTEVVRRRWTPPLWLEASIDLMICNPASLPVAADQKAYWSGGVDGMRMISAMIRVADKVLRNDGRLVYIQTSLAPTQRCFSLLERYGFAGAVTAVARVPFRPFYEPLLPHFLELRSRGRAAFEGSTVRDGFEFLYLVAASRHPTRSPEDHNDDRTTPTPGSSDLHRWDYRDGP